MSAIKFTIKKKLPRGRLGRAGILVTAHGAINTPAFVVVGTKATVKAMTPEQVKSIGAQVVLANTYHLYLEPGEQIVKQGGGLGKFMGWEGPTMTDSGGFQVFSLGSDFDKKVGKIKQNSVIHASAPQGQTLNLEKGLTFSYHCGDDTRNGGLVSIDEDGVSFRSPKDGSSHRFTPERSIEIQHDLGADIIFAFDECVSPDASYEYQKEAMERTHFWAERSLARHKYLIGLTSKPERGRTSKTKQMLFGIIQGGRFEDLRKESARTISTMLARQSIGEGGGFDGFGIGGSFEKKDIDTALGWVNSILPEEKPRHLLGIGEPIDLFGAVENGCDLFDCVAPTRQARNGSLYTTRGKINITNARYKNDFTPIDNDCGCYTCLPSDKGGAGFTKAYLSHLFRANEILANTLASIHNLYFIVHLVKNIRSSIINDSFEIYRKEFLSRYIPSLPRQLAASVRT